LPNAVEKKNAWSVNVADTKLAIPENTAAAAIAAFVGLCVAAMTGGMARAETPEVSSGGAIGLGNRGWSATETSHATSANELEFSARAGVASDYIYRGTTLSARGPAAGAAVEATFDALYAAATVATVKLPTEPGAEFTMAGGIRPKDRNHQFRSRRDLFRLSRRKVSRCDEWHQLLGGGYPRR